MAVTIGYGYIAFDTGPVLPPMYYCAGQIPMARLTIGTAEERIDLLDCHTIMVASWEPTAGATENVYSESSLADGRQLVAYRELNTIETLTIQVRGQTMNQCIRRMQDLRRMLRRAQDYWANRFGDPVFVEARSAYETDSRWALVYAGAVPTDDQAFQRPFVGLHNQSLETDRLLVFERGPWTENPPDGTELRTAVPIAAAETYDGRMLGNVTAGGVLDPTTVSSAVYVGNKRNECNLTDIYWYSTAAGPGYSNNLLDEPFDIDLLDDNAPANNDAVYFGIETAAGVPRPFCSLVFDLATAGAGYTGVWEFYDGITPWATLNVQDNTNADGAMTGDAFDTTGVKSVHWVQPSTWTDFTVNGVRAMWVRYRITLDGNPFVSPVQQNRDIYSIVWPYIEVAEDIVEGDIPALVELALTNESDDDGTVTGVPLLRAGTVWMGTRSKERGVDFTAYLNAAPVQNPAFVTVALTGVGPAFLANVTAPAGYVVRFTNPGTGTNAGYCTWQLASPGGAQFYGTFHAFVRGNIVAPAAATDLWFRLRYGVADTYRETAPIQFRTTDDFAVLDFGRIALLGVPLLVAEGGMLEVALRVDGNAVADVDIYDLILIPTDEWACCARMSSGDSLYLGARGGVASSDPRYLDVDSIRQPLSPLRTLLRDTPAGGSVWSIYMPIGQRPATLKPLKEQRLWMFETDDYFGNTDDPHAFPEIAGSVQLWSNQRYLSFRGDR